MDNLYPQNSPGPEGTPRPLARATDGPESGQRRGGVLVVEDDDLVRSALEAGLRRHGFAVWLAAGGREAIALCRDHLQDIDLVLIDVRMPEMDGPQTWIALESLNPELRCCFMSGDLGRYTEVYLLGLRAARVFQKPFRIEEIANTFRALLAELRSAPVEEVDVGVVPTSQPVQFQR